MSESKEYISQQQENGCLHISEDVIISIAASAILEVEGVFGLSANLGSDIAEILGKKNLSKGVRLTIGDDGIIALDCFIVVKFGGSVMEIAKAVQDSVFSGVESVTGLKVQSVNVTVGGVALPKDAKK